MDRSERQYNINGSLFIVPAKYELQKPIGRGAFGLVCAGRDIPNNRAVAVKKIPGALGANPKDAKRTLRELRLLRHFRGHENVLDVCVPRAHDGAAHDIYVMTGLMETDLHQVITSQQLLTEKHCQYFLYQILRALKYIHSAGVIHRDLKPSNLLVNSDCSLRVCDFGLARVALGLDDVALQEVPAMTEYVATRWYRAPEVILSWKQYTKAIDIWSVGCIFAELLGRRPLFQGSDYMHQVNKIVEVMGSPDPADVAAIHNQAARHYVSSLPPTPRIQWHHLYPQLSAPAGSDLLSRLLAFNPARRITAEDALSHPYLVALHDPHDEPVANALFNFDFENAQLSTEDYQQAQYFHQPPPDAMMVDG